MTSPFTAYVSSFTPYGFGPGAEADEPAPAPLPRLPVAEAEAVLATLPGVISARIVTNAEGVVGEVHVLTGSEVTPRQTVREVETALLSRFGVRVEPRRISVATTTNSAPRAPGGGVARPPVAPGNGSAEFGGAEPGGAASVVAESGPSGGGGGRRSPDARRLYFEDVEARRSARGGLSCRVVLRRGDLQANEADVLVEGEAESPGLMRARSDEVAARAALDALARGGSAGSFALEGSARVTAFGREFVLVGVVARQGRGATLLTGSAEVRDGGAEAAAVLAILDATNRWVARMGDSVGRPRVAA